MGGQQFPINLSGVLVAAMLVLSALLTRPPLVSERPPAAKIRAEPSGPFQTVPARIWEDPLEAVARAEPEAQAQAPGPGDPAPVGAGQAQAAPPLKIIPQYLRHLGAPEGTRAPHDPAHRLVLMPVMIPGAPHPAQREQRLRMRVAVHAGLAMAGFLPLRSDRLGLWTWTQDQAGLQGQTVRMDVPFEAFKRDRPAGGEPDPQRRASRDLVLLLWLSDEFVSQDLGRSEGAAYRRIGPLAGIDSLLEKIDYPSRSEPTGSEATNPNAWRARYDSVAVRLIGPASSDSLEQILAEVWNQHGGDCVHPYGRLDNLPDPGPAAGEAPYLRLWGDRPLNFALISPLATAPRGDLVGGSGEPRGAVSIAGTAPPDRPCASIAIHRTIATDDRIIDGLIRELAIRGLDPGAPNGHAGHLPRLFARLQPGFDPWQPRDHIALIAEWDTKFGRTLPNLFERKLLELHRASTGRPTAGADGPNPRPWIHRYSYARGLDGDTPAPAANARQANKLDILAAASGNDAGFQEPALGTSQYDYLRRLAQRIAELDRTLKRENRGSIKAFAILGNDYFDKLLILQALKEHFPAHLYLTTDLDAGYLDAKVFRYTRNLVVAAPFGLTLRDAQNGGAGESLQGHTPPFRHSYQTSLYLSVLHTLQGREGELSQLAQTDEAQIFEVGYGRFYSLSNPAARESLGGTSVHPESTRPLAREFLYHHATSLGLTLGAALLLLWLSSPSLARRDGASPPPALLGPWTWIAARAVWLTTLAYLLVGGAWLLWAIGRGEEPFAWFSGISIWPTEVVRLLAGLAASLCLIYGWRRVRDADRTIACQFDLPDPTRTSLPRQGYASWYRGDPTPAGPVESQAAHTKAGPVKPGTGQTPAGPGCTRLAARICRLFARQEDGQTDAPIETDRPSPPADQGADTPDSQARGVATDRPHREPPLDGAAIWRGYLPHATLGARLKRVLPAALAFWLFSILVVYGYVDPLSPHRGLHAYLFDTVGGLLLVGLPFIVLLFAAVDEARLCRALLRRLDGTQPQWPGCIRLGGCTVEPESLRAVYHWITTEFIAARTAPAAHVIHLPLLVVLFLLLSFSTRFDNWNTPASVLSLIGLTVAIVLLASRRLRSGAQAIRQQVIEDLKEEVAGIQYALSSRSDRLRQLLERIEAVHDGAYTKWYNEPVTRALAWIAGISIWIVTEYVRVGG